MAKEGTPIRNMGGDTQLPEWFAQGSPKRIDNEVGVTAVTGITQEDLDEEERFTAFIAGLNHPVDGI
jgi:hypothetical protein